MTTPVIAVLASDIHLSHKCPVARSAESNWYAAMQRQLDALWALVVDHECPLVVAGDIFDRWNAPAELINFALRHLPDCYAVPGQHDLPQHSYADIERSAYWTLVEAGKVEHLDHNPYGVPASLDANGSPRLMLYGFPWGYDPAPNMHAAKELDTVSLAVVHAYIWRKGCNYPGAPDTQRVGAYRKQLKGYDAAVFGDNHKSFISRTPDQTIVNCGSFYRRTADEFDHKPMVGLLHQDGMVTPHYFNVSDDQFDTAHIAALAEKAKAKADTPDASKFIDAVKALGSDSLDFRAAVHEYLTTHTVAGPVKSVLLESIDE